MGVFSFPLPKSWLPTPFRAARSAADRHFVNWYFLFFFISGFCSILYELVWLRLSMAQFGVTTALVSIVLSTFMAGLGLGSWISGRLLRRHDLSGSSALLTYASLEFLIGISGLLVPAELSLGRQL